MIAVLVGDSAEYEWETMKSNGFDRIWDCGTTIFVKQI